MNRPAWDEYFLGIMDAAAARATCNRGKSACVITKDNRILVTGYVGAPPGFPHCDEVGHLFHTVINEHGFIFHNCVRTVHAEANAIYQAARFGIPLKDATLYCRMTPCRNCAMAIVNCGIERVVCQRRYKSWEEPMSILNSAFIKVIHVSDDIQNYE